MKIIGHRGARGLVPENTLASLRKALEHHVDMMEFDVRVTKDNVPVLHHNAKMIGADDKKYRISNHSCQELKERFPELVTLDEALEQINAQVISYIEVKAGEPTKPVIQVLKKILGDKYAAQDLRLASKNQKTLRELHKALPEVPVVVIESWSGVRAHYRARELGAQEIAMNQMWLWWGFIRGFKNSDKRLYAYTLNDPARARRWAKWGLAGVITDFPDRFEQNT
jgi:glycerophosphoryl diester phosphodiesterase